MAKKRTIIFTIILIAAIGIPLLSFLIDSGLCMQQVKKQETPGAFYFEDGQSPFFLDEYLTAEWEYYPNQLLYTDSEDDLVSGAIDDSDPAVIGTQRQEQGQTPSGAAPAYSTELHPEAEHILLPAGLSARKSLSTVMPRSASYRLVLKNCPVVDAGDIVVCLQGMENGNYALYLNGRKRMNIVPPFSYPAYYTSMQEEMEIVVETSNGQIPLNIIPRIAYKGAAMAEVDSYRIIFAAMSSALVIASLILMILVFAVEPSKFRWHFSVSLVFSLCMVALNIWVMGFLGPITAVIPTYILARLPIMLMMVGFLVFLFTLRRFYADYYLQKGLFISGVFILLALLFQLADLFFPGTGFSFIVFLATLLLCTAALVLWLINTYRSFSKKVPLDLFFFQTGCLILICGSLCATVYNHFGNLNFVIYIYPICLLIYLVLIFISSKYEQKRLVSNTLKMLELEKENTRYQAAVLNTKLQPHFLYNTLASIQEMCYTEPELASEMIVHLSQYLRDNIDFMDHSDLIPFTQELKHIESYLFIQKARYGNSLNYEQFIGCKDFQIPPFTVQPLIENAINYGVRKNRNGGTVRLETFAEDGTVHIRVSNSGKGFDTSTIKPNHSIMNIKKRLSYLSDGTLEITSSPDEYGTLAEITLPKSSAAKTRKQEEGEEA